VVEYGVRESVVKVRFNAHLRWPVVHIVDAGAFPSTGSEPAVLPDI
jgi:hypothetical protein